MAATGDTRGRVLFSGSKANHPRRPLIFRERYGNRLAFLARRRARRGGLRAPVDLTVHRSNDLAVVRHCDPYTLRVSGQTLLPLYDSHGLRVGHTFQSLYAAVQTIAGP